MRGTEAAAADEHEGRAFRRREPTQLELAGDAASDRALERPQRRGHPVAGDGECEQIDAGARRGAAG